CGFGGAFAWKNADTSVAMVADKVRRIGGSGAEVVCSDDDACLMQIGGALSRLPGGVRAVHLAEVLGETASAPAGPPARARRRARRRGRARPGPGRPGAG